MGAIICWVLRFQSGKYKKYLFGMGVNWKKTVFLPTLKKNKIFLPFLS